MFRTLLLRDFGFARLLKTYVRTVSRKNLTTVESFIAEPDSRAQCVALEDNVKEFGLTYFGMKDRRQGQLSRQTYFVI